MKTLNLKLVILLEYQNIKILPNWSEEVFVIKKVKNALPWTDVINDLNGEEHFMKKSCKKQIRKNLE